MQSCSVAALTPASLTIQANNANIFQGQTLPLLTATYLGFVNGETSANLTTQPQINTSGNSASPQGNYPIIASGAASPNYTISYQNGHLQITAAPLPPVTPPPQRPILPHRPLLHHHQPPQVLPLPQARAQQQVAAVQAVVQEVAQTFKHQFIQRVE